MHPKQLCEIEIVRNLRLDFIKIIKQMCRYVKYFIIKQLRIELQILLRNDYQKKLLN